MTSVRRAIITLAILASASVAFAEPASFANTSVGIVRFDVAATQRPARAALRLDDAAIARQSAPEPVAAVDYSPAYQRRAKIHKLASMAMLPLFVTEGWLGQSIYSNPTPGKRDAHVAVAAGIGGLFAVNTVTGVWNMVEARHDPNGRGRRLHGFLMLAADAGFLTTALVAPGQDGSGSRSLHRTMAFTAISTATVGYLVMILGGH